MIKLTPGFTRNFFTTLIPAIENDKLPLTDGQTAEDLLSLLIPVIFDEKYFGRKVERREGADLIAESAVNFYESVNQQEVESYYSDKTDPTDSHPLSVGLNSRIVKHEGKIVEEVYRSGGLYGKAIDQIIMWLEKAIDFASSELQRRGIRLLIDFYRSGDLKTWDDYNVIWARDIEPEVDYNNGFIETYSDPLGMKATWEAIVNYTDIEATKRSRTYYCQRSVV